MRGKLRLMLQRSFVIFYGKRSNVGLAFWCFISTSLLVHYLDSKPFFFFAKSMEGMLILPRFNVQYAQELYGQQPTHNSPGVWK